MERRVLDYGRVVLKGYTIDLDDGNKTLDNQVVRAARTSYAGGTKTVREDRALIDYLIRHEHWSPFEMVELKFFIEAPLFVVQQLLRHRTANVNQESARYSVLQDLVYRPSQWRLQSTTNKQGSGLPIANSDMVTDVYAKTVTDSLNTYHALLDEGVARELARCVLPVSTYTKLYWKIDLRNLLHFLHLRLDAHAQAETRAYAQAIYDLAKPLAPWTFESWERHVRNAVKFSSDEWELISTAINYNTLQQKLEQSGLSTSRLRELKQRLGLGDE